MSAVPSPMLAPERSLAPIVRLASTIVQRELEPLQPGRLWVGKVTMDAGDPGLGKSLVAIDTAARVTTGAPWPCSSTGCGVGEVLLVSAEDDAEDTIIPRLIAAGADLNRIAFLQGVRETEDDGSSHERLLSLDLHLEQLAEAVKARRGNIRLVVVDPISAFLGRTDSHNNSEVRAVLAGLGRIASELRFAVLVISHLNKGGSANAVYRVTGSLAFVAAARAAFAITRDPDDSQRRLVLPVKVNLGPDTHGYAYTIGVADNDAPMILWADERVTKTADEILAGAISPREQAVVERVSEVQAWLRTQLEGEAQPAASMWGAGERAGYSRRDIERAKRSLGVRAEVKGFRGAWHWVLPR